MCLCCTLECSAHRGQKRAEDHLELELELLGMDAELSLQLQGAKILLQAIWPHTLLCLDSQPFHKWGGYPPRGPWSLLRPWKL